jgi:hypothetical protein
MTRTSYRYELRAGRTITATGHVSYETPLAIGDEITIGNRTGTVHELGPRLPDGDHRLVVRLHADDRNTRSLSDPNELSPPSR